VTGTPDTDLGDLAVVKESTRSLTHDRSSAETERLDWLLPAGSPRAVLEHA
jgi:hypothetical protein